MVFASKTAGWVVGVLFLSGCCTLCQKEPSAYEKGYRDGVKENIDQYARVFAGGDFPYYYWQSPQQQYVTVPGQVVNGCMIPEHKELVVIKPGEWRESFAYPIKTGGENEKGKKEGYVYTNSNSTDITSLPADFSNSTN